MTNTSTPQPFAVGQRVRVTPEYAAWYREMSGGWSPSITPDTRLMVYGVDNDGIWVQEMGNEVVAYTHLPAEYLVSAEPD